MASYTISTIARKLSLSNFGSCVTEDRVYSWVRNGTLQAEPIISQERGYGKYPFLVEKDDLIPVLQAKGYDFTSFTE